MTVYKITEGKPAIFWFTGEIDSFAAKGFTDAIGQARNGGASEIHIGINSLGGVVEEAFFVHNVIRQDGAPVSVYNAGAVQSAAVTLFLGAEPTRRFVAPGAYFMIHPVYFNMHAGTITWRTATDFATRCDAADRLTDAVLAERAPKLPKEDREGRMTRDIYIGYKRAIEVGLAAQEGVLPNPPDGCKVGLIAHT